SRSWFGHCPTGFGRVDPHRLRKWLVLGRVTHEALRVLGVSGFEHALPLGDRLLRLAVVNGFRREHGDAAMTMLCVVPVEELAAEALGILLAAELLRKLRPVLKRLELRLRVRVVVRKLKKLKDGILLSNYI